ncbi:MAG: MBL fold metallo-hydrolase [Lachnospiraceae bacterium]|nr:MBL fold metallo-hydrolase [Lachnospiraceae bacterium]
MRLCSIASGSSGNCVYVGSDATHILIDAGISGKRTEAGLNKLDITGYDIDGIFITHEHSDHIGGLGVLARRYGIPIYATGGTVDGILSSSSLGKIDLDLINVIKPDEKVIVKDLIFNPMRISHDAKEPVAYRIHYGNTKVAVITDLGSFNDYTVECLKGMDALLLEANHDVNMLEVGPYPYYLKQRILSERGHLSNELAGRLLSRLLHSQLKTVLLGHLSQENNLPELAYEAVRVEVNMADNEFKAADFPMIVASRSEVSPVINI